MGICFRPLTPHTIKSEQLEESFLHTPSRFAKEVTYHGRRRERHPEF